MIFLNRKLKKSELAEISKAIQKAEKNTSGEIRVHLSFCKNETDPLKSAQLHFESEKMYQTELRNSVLLLVNPAAKKFALYGDVGIHEKVKQEYWNELSASMSSMIKEKNLTQGIVHAVEKLGQVLTQYFPCSKNTKNENELSDEVTQS